MSEANKRILEQLAVIATFPDSVTAMKSYQELHRKAPERELYVFHTSRETLDIAERRWLGIREAQFSQPSCSLESQYPLQGTVVRYDDPFTPVAQLDWEVLQ